MNTERTDSDDAPEKSQPPSRKAPFPAGYTEPWKLRDGTPVLIRPIRPEDEPLVAAFHHTLSERSVYFRYFTTFKLDQRIAHERLARICFIDHDTEMAVVAEHATAQGGKEIIAVGRLSRLHGAREAEFAILVSDRWQGLGLGVELLRRLVQIGRDENLDRLSAVMLGDNHRMQTLVRSAGFKVTCDTNNNECRATLELGA